MMDLRRLRTLAAVVEHGSFGRAADALGYTPSAVSQQISELERAVGLPLLMRRPVRATEAGRIAIAAADAASAVLDGAGTELRGLRDGEAGVLRLGAFASAARTLVPPALQALAASHPGIRVTVVQHEPADAYAELVRGELDLAITFDDPVGPPIPAPVQHEELLTDDLLVALPSAHALAAREKVMMPQLLAERWIDAPDAGAPALRAQRTRGLDDALRYEGDDPSAVLALVAAGLGVAVVASLAARALPEGVTTRPLAGQEADGRKVFVARLGADRVAPAVAALETHFRCCSSAESPSEATARTDRPPA